MDENNQSQNEHVYSTVAKNAYILPEPPQRNKTPWIIGIVIAILMSFGLGVGFCLWMLRDMAPTEDTVVTKAPELPSAPHITDVADIPETPAEDMTPEDATATPADPPEDTNGAPVDPPATVAPEASIQTAPEPETPPKPDDPVDPESTDAPDIPVEPETTACAHEYSDWQITTPATCTGAGLQTQSCQLCGEERKEPIEPTGHTEEEVPAVAPTCTDHGYTAGIICTECGVMVVGQEIVPAAHTPGEWIIDQEPELGIDGSKHTECTVCGEVIEETIEMLYSQGLTYVSNGQGTCYVSGIGTCTDTKIVIPATYKERRVTQIGYRAFGNCQNLTSIIIPDSVTSIGGYAFERCSKLTSIIIPNSVTHISSYTFNGCSNLASITIPSSVTHIDQSAFSGCSNLASITIPSSVTHIGQSAFSGCSKLFSLTIPSGVSNIEEGAFAGIAESASIEIDPENSSYCSIDGILYDANLTVLLYCPKNQTTVSIPNTVTRIGDYAFSQCSGLTSVTLSDGLTSIGEHAFYYCTGLTSIAIPESVTKIEESAFSYCKKLSSINIPDGITSIEYSTFHGCNNLASIDLPDSVTSIGYYAFLECENLSTIVIPANVTSIGSCPFVNCSNLSKIVVEEGNPMYHSDGNCLIETASKTLILGCKNSIIPTDGSVAHIEEAAFRGCTGLTSLTIPDSVISIGTIAFEGCSGLTSVIIGNGVTTIDRQAFQDCTSLTSVTISNSVTNIGHRIFNRCENLTDLYYTGTQEAWAAITKDAEWDAYSGIYTLHFNYTPET